MLLALTHLCFPRARRHTFKFFCLSYYNKETGQYYSGWNDAFVVFFCITVFTGLRAAVMDYILLPLAKKGGVKTARDQTRFCEQAWLLVYLSFTWTLGMVSFQIFWAGEALANDRTVHIGKLGILAQSERTLDQLAEPRNGIHPQVLHFDTIRFLAAATASYPHRSKKKGPHADAHASYSYHHLDIYRLWIPSN